MTGLEVRPLNAPTLLKIWEVGQARGPVDRALLLLSAACQGQDGSSLAELSLGQRDALLYRLREQMFAARLDAQARCPACGARLEFSLNTSELNQGGPAAPLEFTCGAWQVHFRLPNSRDLATLTARAGENPLPAEQASSQLALGCVIAALRDGAPVPPEQVPGEVLAELAARITAADPLAEVLLDLTCPVCAHRWPLLLDITSFLWAEIEDRAARLLEEVHTLARAYGWSEADILALSSRRRRWYIERVAND